MRQNINDLLDDVLGCKPATEKAAASPAATYTPSSKLKELLDLPDVTFLQKNKYSLTEYNWWSDIFNQPSFCGTASSAKTCSQCERKHSTDHQVILFQVHSPSLTTSWSFYFKQHLVCLNVAWGCKINELRVLELAMMSIYRPNVTELHDIAIQVLQYYMYSWAVAMTESFSYGNLQSICCSQYSVIISDTSILYNNKAPALDNSV